MMEFVVCRADEANTGVLELRTTGTTEDLHDVENAEIHKFTLLWVVQLGSFNDNRGGRQVDTPSESGGTSEDLNKTFGEHSLHEVTVAAAHSSMMSTETTREKVP